MTVSNHVGTGNQILGPLEEQQVLLPAKSSFQPHPLIFKDRILKKNVQKKKKDKILLYSTGLKLNPTPTTQIVGLYKQGPLHSDLYATKALSSLKVYS